MINLINKLFYFCDYKLNGVDLPKAFLLRSWKGLYYWNVFGGSVDWVYAFQVRGNQSLSDHVDMVYQASKKQGRINHDLVKD